MDKFLSPKWYDGKKNQMPARTIVPFWAITVVVALVAFVIIALLSSMFASQLKNAPARPVESFRPVLPKKGACYVQHPKLVEKGYCVETMEDDCKKTPSDSGDYLGWYSGEGCPGRDLEPGIVVYSAEANTCQKAEDDCLKKIKEEVKCPDKTTKTFVKEPSVSKNPRHKVGPITCDVTCFTVASCQKKPSL